jgi:transcriptional regulator with XRE-family HTH domain
MLRETLGGRIRRVRVERGLSLAQVARDDFSRAFLNQVELEKCRPSVGALAVIAERLDVPLDTLMGTEERFLRRRLTVEAARIALARGDAARALELASPLTSASAWPLGADARLCTAAALGALGRDQEAGELLDRVQPELRARGDEGRLARLEEIRSGRRRPPTAEGSEHLAERALAAGDLPGALEELTAARVLTEAQVAVRPSPLGRGGRARRAPGPARLRPRGIGE